MLLFSVSKVIFAIIRKVRFVQASLIIPVLLFLRHIIRTENGSINDIITFTGFSTTSLTIGLITGVVVMAYYIMNIYQKYEVTRMTCSKFEYLGNIYVLFILSSGIISAYYVGLAFVCGYTRCENFEGWEDVIDNGDYLIVGLRLFFVLMMFMTMCMGLFFLITNLTGKPQIASLLVLSILILDVGQSIYTGMYIIRDYLYPVYNFEFSKFTYGILRLLAFNIGMYLLNLICLENRDFLDMGGHHIWKAK